MSRDLTIRLLGRPQVSTDQRTGLKKLVRKYVVEGPRASKAGLEDENFPLFLPGGSTDEEFTDYFLTNQMLAPASGSLDKAYLSREFLQLKTAPITQDRIETNDLIRVRKRFAVLRSDHASVGYGSAWSNHPSQGGTSSNPWDYAPPNAKTSPDAASYDYDTLASGSGLADNPVVITYDALGQPVETNFGSFLTTTLSSSGNWLQGLASVARAGSELDIWTLEWVTHSTPYWTVGTTSVKNKASNARRKIDFDHYGISVLDEGGTVSGTALTKAKTFVSFVVAEKVPEDLSEIAGGAYTSTRNASVNIDLFIEDAEGKSWAMKQSFKNAVWRSSTQGSIEFPTGSGSEIAVTQIPGSFSYEFNFNAMEADDINPKAEYSLAADSGGVGGLDIVKLPLFQMKPIRKIGGRISWTMTSRTGIATTGNVSNTSTRIAPIFSGEGKKIWKIAITYVGS
jgi:hypothetical protein